MSTEEKRTSLERVEILEDVKRLASELLETDPNQGRFYLPLKHKLVSRLLDLDHYDTR